ncbi:YLS9 protein [Spatholobus suberectus]|nr:YLS9 protein [Spatholobus suberectus]
MYIQTHLFTAKKPKALYVTVFPSFEFPLPHSTWPINNRNQPNIAETNDAPSVHSKERLRTRCCHCLCRTFWMLLVLVITLVMLIILVLYIIITPRSFKFRVTEARLAQFDRPTGDNTLRYNLVLNITARNPNKKLKIYYDVVQAHALYEGVRFATADVSMPWRSYLQDKKGHRPLQRGFRGTTCGGAKSKAGSGSEIFSPGTSMPEPFASSRFLWLLLTGKRWLRLTPPSAKSISEFELVGWGLLRCG